MLHLPRQPLKYIFVFLFAANTSLCNAQNSEKPSTRPVLAADAVQEAFVRVAEQIKPSVVTIYTERTSAASTPGSAPDENPGEEDETLPFPFGQRDPNQRRASLGTGIVVSERGFILTNYHVVRDAAVIRVIFNADSERPPRPVANLVAFDEESDLAVLRLAPRGSRPELRPVEFGDSDKVRIGEWAIAVGAPFDQAQTVTVGVISAKGRHLDRDDRLSLQDYIQTDASINPGNSGGPLVNLEGEVIGINTAILSPSRFNVGIGFAVPSNTAREYLPFLTEGKSIARGFLGIQYTSLDPEVAREFGVAGGMQIGALAKRGEEIIGPAKEAGLMVGDIVTHVDGREMVSTEEFRRAVASRAPGTPLRFSVVRPSPGGNIVRDYTITLGDWTLLNGKTVAAPPLPPPAAPASKLGLRVEAIEKLSADERKLFGVDASARGVIITEVLPASPADDAQIRRGWRIARLRVNGGAWQSFTNPRDFTRLELGLPAAARVLFQLRDRSDVSIYKVIVLPEDD